MEEILSLIMDVGEHMLRSGAEVHRVEESIKRMGLSEGFRRVDILVITSSMTVTAFTEDGSTLTESRRITDTATDFEKVHRLNDLSRKICAKKIKKEEISAELERALSCKSYPVVAEVLCCALASGAFTLFFGGGAIEAVVSFFIGALVRLAAKLIDKLVVNKIFSKFFCSIIATSLAFAALKCGFIGAVDKVMIGNIMLLISGIGFTNAIRDLFIGDSISGLLRSVESILIALAIAAGYFTVAAIGGGLL